MKSYHVHYLNKYPGGFVRSGEDYVDAYCAEGLHRVALRKNGAGQWTDVSEEMGCVDRHDLGSIPKDSRVHKLHKDGKIGLDELHAERSKAREKFVHNGKVYSEAQIAILESLSKGAKPEEMDEKLLGNAQLTCKELNAISKK